ncbi:hypothetical protein H2O64_20470 [Kordia sp. YSTF-M3]|uniref:Uncharacterized protein n=1 Tax=Kordia aestuariivivens TaxID=2759037 RepID=A0ABR7QEU0_9FLAO|nr:DUF6544 family protein [Kordia aestuariivivens]MBC8757059.1 hypothetical protein [Kordia aestuariivivens]
MKYAFTFLVLIHGIIHLFGFVNAFFSTEASKQVLGISKPIGAFWLVTFILFIVTAVSFFNNKKWFYIAFLAVFVSQILIFTVWNDAKFGTILNVIILVVSIATFGNYSFHKMVEKEVEAVLNDCQISKKTISENDLLQLPEIVQKWLKTSGVIGKQDLSSVRLQQKGLMRTKPKSTWMPFEAVQYFNTKKPAFIWRTNVKAMPMISMVGRDKLWNGEGEMLIKLAGIIPVVNDGKNHKVNSGTMLRFLSEMCWFPSAVLNDYITWETIDETSAKATFTHHNQEVSGIFYFTPTGDLIAFEATRYYGGGTAAKLEKWRIEMTSFNVFNGIKIPNKANVIWKLQEGDFHWLSVEIIDIRYNTKNSY